MINPEAQGADVELERRIDREAQRCIHAGTTDEQLAAWEEFKRLHAQRSAEQVEAMEREQGLR